MPLADTRQDMLTRLQEQMPEYTWLKGRLMPYMAHATQSYGAVSTLRSQQGQDFDQHIQHFIIVQLYRPCTANPENVTVATLADPADIETDVEAALAALLNVELGAQAHYWFLTPVSVDYPSDPNGQQTRAEVTFSAFDSSPWH